MRFIIILYTITTILCLMLGTGSMYWALINVFNMLAFIIVLLNVKFKKDLFTKFATQTTTVNILYTSICAISQTQWIYAMNRVVATILMTWLIITTIIHHINGGQKFR